MKRKCSTKKISPATTLQNTFDSPCHCPDTKHLRVACYLAALIALVTFAIYLPTLQNGFISWDDDLYVSDNCHLRDLDLTFMAWAFTELSGGLWHPLTWISFGIDHALWGTNPAGYHLTAIVLHAVNTFLVAFLVAKLLSFGRDNREDSSPGSVADRRSVLIVSGVTGVLFGLHPLHVESVAWVSERKDLLYACFYLLSISWYIEYARDRQGTGGGWISAFGNGKYLVSLAFFLCALCSKAMAVSLPVVLMILDWYPLRRITSRESTIIAFLEKLPHMVCCLLVSLVTVLAQKEAGAMVLAEALPLSGRVLVAVKALIMYLLKIIAPHDLLPIYPYPKLVSLLMPEYFLALLATCAISACCILAGKQRLWLSLWGFYVVTLLPVLGIIQVGRQSMADRYTYVASIGPFIVCGLAVAWGWNRAHAYRTCGHLLKVVLAFTTVSLCGPLAYATGNQVAIWKDSITFWSYLIGKEPVRVPEAYLNRGYSYWDMNQLDPAIADFSTAIHLNPQYGAAYLNRGMAFVRKGDLDQAQRDFTCAIQSKPGYTDAYNNRGSLFNRKGKFDLALKDLDRALALDSSCYPAYINRGIAYGGKGDLNRAIENYSTALSLKPDSANAYLGRGDLYAKAADFERAVKDYKLACDLGMEAACNKALLPLPLPTVVSPRSVQPPSMPVNLVSNVPKMNLQGIDELVNKLSEPASGPPPDTLQEVRPTTPPP